MKIILFLGIAIALLKSATALLPNSDNHHDHQARHDGKQDVLEPAREGGSNAHPEAAEKVEVGVPRRKDESVPQPSFTSIEILDADAINPLYSNSQDPSSSHSTYLSHKHRFPLGSKTNQWAITYTPYNADLTCKTPSTIFSDVAAIAKAGFTSIRLYATDCRALDRVGAAATSHKLKLIVGVHIEDPILGLVQPQIVEIAAWAAAKKGRWQLLEMVVVGNESIFNEAADAASLAAFVNAARAYLRERGYVGPVTTTEPLPVLWYYRATLCPALDVAAANIHPFFHNEVSAETAGDFVAEQLSFLEDACEGLQAVNLETGWPKRGLKHGDAAPSVLDQMLAVHNVKEAAGGRSVFLSWEDELWRDEGDMGLETSWGCGQLFGE
ncbi:hypothetical protein MMC21_000541 [Puttea exsequens]|nr:hypothetical protein [Puttea exsequens]